MAGSASTSYDEIPYESLPFAATHPSLLFINGTILGLNPKPVQECRVLELGCASGGNLIPMAYCLPRSTFVGIDLSARQVADGQKRVDELKLPNIQLKQFSILDVTKDFGTFDYILCHGIFSWVPRPVQDRILEICSENLAVDGVAYVSYNTYPGWHMRGMIRDMMCYHAKQFSKPTETIQQARALLDFLVKSVTQENSPYAMLLKSELEIISKKADSYLYHEHLEEYNEPLYFFQFMERATAKGLQYLSETDLAFMLPSNFSAEVNDVLKKISTDILHIEQYMDFLRNRMFRQTLLVHKSVKPQYNPSVSVVSTLHVASPSKPVSPKPNIHSNGMEKFQGPDGTTLNSTDPLVKSAMAYLSESYPRAVPFETLRQTARSRLTPGKLPDERTAAQDRDNLGRSLLNSYITVSTRMIELRAYEPSFLMEVTERPTASPLARLQSLEGARVTNMLHRSCLLEDLDRQVIRQLDGTHTRSEVVEILADLAAKNQLVVKKDDILVTDPEIVKQVFEGAVDHTLKKFAHWCLLVG